MLDREYASSQVQPSILRNYLDHKGEKVFANGNLYNNTVIWHYDDATVVLTETLAGECEVGKVNLRVFGDSEVFETLEAILCEKPFAEKKA